MNALAVDGPDAAALFALVLERAAGHARVLIAAGAGHTAAIVVAAAAVRDAAAGEPAAGDGHAGDAWIADDLDRRRGVAVSGSGASGARLEVDGGAGGLAQLGRQWIAGVI